MTCVRVVQCLLRLRLGGDADTLDLREEGEEGGYLFVQEFGLCEFFDDECELEDGRVVGSFSVLNYLVLEMVCVVF